ncbi:cadherin repeat domain-containing protein [Hankyongella ginsenosidimutans]|uniref:cadherin repeat domain-containing protein n=1 Tax=Hankyongella ginsenosidimutans TaxID=1763828 RepID=UPI001FEB3700|nr:cadherin repeat domain-containing protein [Hankyongella ginsenosidimutans]
MFSVTITPVNDVPIITSNGGGDTAGISVAENTRAVTTVTAADPDAGTVLAYSIAGGADAARFIINTSTGALAFLSAPNFETPGDLDDNNIYDVIVRASDAGACSTSKYCL